MIDVVFPHDTQWWPFDQHSHAVNSEDSPRGVAWAKGQKSNKEDEWSVLNGRLQGDVCFGMQ